MSAMEEFVLQFSKPSVVEPDSRNSPARDILEEDIPWADRQSTTSRAMNEAHNEGR